MTIQEYKQRRMNFNNLNMNYLLLNHDLLLQRQELLNYVKYFLCTEFINNVD